MGMINSSLLTEYYWRDDWYMAWGQNIYFFQNSFKKFFLDIYITPPFLKFYDARFYYFELSISLLFEIRVDVL